MVDQFTCDTTLLKDFLDILVATGPEAILQIGNGKIYARMVDTANIQLTDIEMPCTTDTVWKFGADLIKLKAVVKLLKDTTTTVTLEGNQTVIVTKRATYKNTTLHESTLRKPPGDIQLPWLTTLQLKVEDLVEAFNAVTVGKAKKDTGQGVWIKWDLHELHLANNDQLDPIVATFHPDELTVIKPSLVPCVTYLPLDYVDIINGKLSQFDTCLVGIGNHCPMGFMITSTSGVRCAFWISPRMPREDEICPL